MRLKYIFGPVLSRRLGKSLGIDLIPFKTCPFDCIYCECGKTNCLTLERKEYTATSEVIAEIDGYLKYKPDLDYITFAGSGEPLLHKGIGRIIKFIKDKYPQYKIAVITNSVFFKDIKIIDSIIDANLIIPSLDAVSQEIFEVINRPAKHIKVHEIIKGLKILNSIYTGEIWLEIFIIPGINDMEEELSKFNKVITEISPDKIQLNTIDRPGTEEWISKVEKNKLRNIAEKIKGDSSIEIEIL